MQAPRKPTRLLERPVFRSMQHLLLRKDTARMLNGQSYSMGRFEQPGFSVHLDTERPNAVPEPLEQCGETDKRNLARWFRAKGQRPIALGTQRVRRSDYEKRRAHRAL